MKTDLYNLQGEKTGTIELPEKIFNIKINEDVIYQVVNVQITNSRQNLAHTKNRSDVKGGGKKPWRQKGTGRARQGSIRSPQWRGGGVVFGPTPRSYGYKLPQKVRQLALKSVYSEKVAENKLVAVDALNFDAPKTAEFVKVLEALAIERKVLVIFENEGNKFAELSARNIPNVQVTTANSASVLDIVNNDKILVTQAALSQIEEVLA